MLKKAPKRMPRQITEVDQRIGLRIRARRLELKMSQAELGEKLGVSFQQVQKYEKGVNRIGGSRMQDLATALGVSVPYFYPEIKQANVESDISGFLASADFMRMVRAVAAIKDSKIRAWFIGVVKELAVSVNEIE